MTIKVVSILLESQYLEDEARKLGISRTKLVSATMKKIIRKQLVPKILSETDPELNEPRRRNYRRFPERHSD
jgi:hypothetical protein